MERLFFAKFAGWRPHPERIGYNPAALPPTFYQGKRTFGRTPAPYNVAPKPEEDLPIITRVPERSNSLTRV